MSTTTEISIDLLPFCAKENGRFHLITPFVMNGWMIATDARICVRYPCSDINTPSKFIDGSVTPFPNANKIFDTEGYAFDGETEPFPVNNCADCKGGGKRIVMAACKNCNECFEVTPDDVHCKTCAGAGSSLHVIVIKERPIHWRYIRLINTLPDARVLAHCPARNNDHTNSTPLPFIFAGGGQGLVMPTSDVNY